MDIIKEHHNKVVGYNTEDLSIFVCDYTFSNTNDSEVHGAIGSILFPVRESDVEKYNSIDYVVDTLTNAGLYEIYDGDGRGVQMITEDLTTEFCSMKDNPTDTEIALYITRNLFNRIEDTKVEIAQEWIDNADGLYPFHDDSDSSYVTEELQQIINPQFELTLGESVVGYECVAGGRCFSTKVFNDSGFVAINNELIETIKRYENLS